MTGTVDSVTTVWMRLAPPRGITRSTRPRAVMSARAASWPPPSSRHTAFSSIPCAARASRITPTSARLLDAAAEPPRRITALPLLRARVGGVHRDVGPGLVDHPDDAHRHAHLADLQAVGQRRAAHDLTDRVGQRRDVAHRLGDRRDPPARRGVSRSSSPSERPLSRPRSRSSAFAVTISPVAATRASAIACSASSFAVRGSSASCREARRAPSASAFTCSTAAGSIVSAAMSPEYGAPVRRRPWVTA